MNPTSWTVNTLRRFKVNKAYRKIRSYLPDWLSSSIRELSRQHGGDRLILIDELRPKYKEAFSYLRKQLGTEKLGDYLEFGVCHGTSMMCMHQTVQKLKLKNVQLIGFDSFEGMPEAAAAEDDGQWKPGEFASPIEKTTQFLTNEGVDWTRTFLIKGWYSDTLTEATRANYKISKASIIMVDCDIYSSAKTSLDFCAPLIKDKAVIFFDDWIGSNKGEGKAFDEFLAENVHLKAEKFGTYEPTGEIFLITNTMASA